MDVFWPLIELVTMLFSVGASLLLAIFVYKNNPKRTVNQVFVTLSIVNAIWVYVMYVSSGTAYIASNIIWLRLSIFFAVPQVVLYYWLARSLPNRTLKPSIDTIVLSGVGMIGMMILTLTPYVFTSVMISDASPHPVVGPAIILFSSYSVMYSLAAIYTLFSKYIKLRGLEREQVKLVLYGMLLMLGCIIFTILLPVAIFQNNTFVSFAPLYTLLFLYATGYAIVKHRMLDIRAVVARSVAFTFLILVIGVLYSIVFFVIGSTIFNIETTGIEIVFSTGFALVIATTYQPLLHRIEKITDKVFYKDRYDAQKLLSRQGRIMASTLELKELAELLIKNLTKDMRIDVGCISLLHNGDDLWTYQDTFHSSKKRFEYRREYIEMLMEKSLHKNGEKILIYEEVKDQDIKKIMKEYGIYIAFPLVVHKKAIGLMHLGHKLSGDIYTKDDINVLEILAPEISVAVKNSLQYEEIKEFNETLQEKVKEATKRLRKANQRLKELDQMKDDFVSVASHELRTPMTAIKSYLWMALSGKGGKLTKKQEFYLERSYKSTDRLIKLVNDMLNISRIESGRLTVHFDKVNLVDVANEVLDAVKPHAEELKVKVSIKKAKIPDVVADADKIKEVFFNLIGNSLKFTPEGGSVTLSFEEKDGKVICSVKDTGRGIAAQDLPTLFRKFGMVEGSYATNKKASGTGLGLFISKSIVEMHGGEITPASEGIDKGSTFSFSLPVYKKGAIKKLEKMNKGKINKGKEEKGIIHTGV